MELKISDSERAGDDQICGVDPLAGGVTRRVKDERTVLGFQIASDGDLLNAGVGQIVESPATRRGRRVVVQIEKKRDKDATVFPVGVRS